MLFRPVMFALAILLCWGAAATATAQEAFGNASLAEHPGMLEEPFSSQTLDANLDESFALPEQESAIDLFHDGNLVFPSVRSGNRPIVSLDGLIGRRIERLTDSHSWGDHGGFRLRLQSDFESKFLGFSSWEAAGCWLDGDQFGFAQVSTRTVGVRSGQTRELLIVDRWETRSRQPFAGGQWNIHQDLGGAADDRRGNFTQLLGVRYVYNAEDYDTVYYGSVMSNSSGVLGSQTGGRPFNGGKAANQMVGLQMGYGGDWSTDRIQFSARLVGGLLGNYASHDGWYTSSVINAAPSTFNTPRPRRYFSDDRFRLSSLMEMDVSTIYHFRDNLDLALGAYAIHLTGQGIGGTFDLFNTDDDLALVGLRLGATYRR